MQQDVLYELVGCINGMPIDATGSGLMDFSAGRYELDVEIDRVPFHWDPGFIILICCDRMHGFFSREIGNGLNLRNRCGDDYRIRKRGGPMLRPGGQLLAQVSASSIGGIVGGKIFSRSQIIEGRFDLGLDEELASVETPHHAILRPLGRDELLLTSTIEFSTTVDGGCYGYVNYPIYAQDQSAFVPLRADEISVIVATTINVRTAWTETRGAKTHFTVESSVSSFTF